ncbi:sulfate ABC transporter permease subunit CysT [Nitrospirillum sp. BR 11828]|uniref:sulfate ABC transporter permease subunit CysT n=1 Tax=Nitrospirillum sp. BR 11828 TaxID=3104325 RepID=UPI002ACABEC0|nr:sulfate ABC transporter permease subunit CysT [Nitrospirillum sp. BR 11828]MDZ5646269.1 sulfate ABC transporter permease subunit CysT [Nitrospirillum sp. BR 11828]
MASAKTARPAKRGWSFLAPTILPGFGTAFGFSLAYLCLIVLIPLGHMALLAAGVGWTKFWSITLAPRVLHAFYISFGCALAAALINAVFGLVVAWVLVRYRFPGRRLIDAMVDLPFALPTSVAGIALTAIYAPNGWIGALAKAAGFKIAFTPIGIVIALVFVGLPFIVRTVEPVLQDLDAEVEEAAASLGATRWQTFTKVLLPAILPALITGVALAFARGVGEYGSVIFIAGNIPAVSEIVPLLIVARLEQYDYAGATVIATAMMGVSFLMLLGINFLQRWTRSRHAR